MSLLIQSESYKLVRSKAFGLILLIVLAIIALDLSSAINYSDVDMYGMYILGEIPSYSVFFQMALIAFAGFFSALDFQYGTIRNLISLGKHRVAIYFSKLFSIFAATAITIVFFTLIETLLYSAVYGFGDVPAGKYLLSFLNIIGLQIYFHFGYASVILMFVFICRSAVLPIVITFIMMFGNILLPQILGGFFGGKYAFLIDYLLQTYTEQIVPGAAVSNLALGTATCAGYIIVSSVIGVLAFWKSDVK